MLSYSLIYINNCTYYQTPSHSPEMFGVMIQPGASEYRDPVPVSESRGLVMGSEILP